MNDDLYIKASNKEFDAIVIGSGISGGWAAKELTEKGLKTLMIERGRVVEHRKDYIGEGVPPWKMSYRNLVDNQLVEDQYKIQKQCYAFSDATKHFFGNDRDLPYSVADGTGFSWIRGNQLGGRSLLWHRQSYRFSEHDFSANKNDGHGNDWPIRYKDLAKWYDHVELFAGISGSYEGLEQLPDGQFLPPFEMMKPELALKKSIEAEFPGRKLIIGRTAHLTKPTAQHLALGRMQCQARDECQKGCSFGAYFSTQSATLPAAVNTGKLHIAPNSVVHSLIYDEKTNRVKGVRVIDNDNLSQREYFGKIVFLCASTLGSTQIMLHSVSKKFPNGIANSSGVLGHYLMDHNQNAIMLGDIPGFENEYYSGRRPVPFLIPNFRYKPSLYAKRYVRGFAYNGFIFRKDWQDFLHTEGLGVEYKHQLKQAGPWAIFMFAQGEMLPKFENQVSLHPTKKDKWGIPQIHTQVVWSENEKSMMQDAAAEGENMLKKAGFENVNSILPDGPPGLAIHEMGTARMGQDPKSSVLNGWCQSHDIPNLFVTDGSGCCSSTAQNPSLTYMALTARAVDYAVREFRARRL